MLCLLVTNHKQPKVLVQHTLEQNCFRIKCLIQFFTFKILTSARNLFFFNFSKINCKKLHQTFYDNLFCCRLHSGSLCLGIVMFLRRETKKVNPNKTNNLPYYGKKFERKENFADYAFFCRNCRVKVETGKQIPAKVFKINVHRKFLPLR